jgi:iron complex outermembrane receptor protein
MGLLFSDIQEWESRDDFGGGYNKYEGNHFGKVIWAVRVHKRKQDRYYDDYAKNDGNIFAKANYQIANKLSLFGDLVEKRAL